MELFKEYPKIITGSKDEVTEFIADILGVDQKIIEDSFGANESPYWDSLDNIEIVVAIEEAMGAVFTDKEITDLLCVSNVEQMVDFIQSRLTPTISQ